MVQIRKVGTTAPCADAGAIADAGQDAGVAQDDSSGSEASTARTTGSDPWAGLGGGMQLHADVRRLADVPRDPVIDRALQGEDAPRADAPVLRWNPDDKKQEVGGGRRAKKTHYDVSTTTQKDIDALKRTDITAAELKRLKHPEISRPQLEKLQKSKKPADNEKAAGIVADRKKAHDIEAERRLGATIENAKVSYAKELNKVDIIVLASDANGGQPVMVVKSKAFKADQPALVHTHYHGDNATVADPEGSKSGMHTRIMDTIAKNPQTVFVLPEAANTGPAMDSPTHDNRYSVNWREVKSQAQTTVDALAAAGVKKPAYHVVSLHSGAGKVPQVLMNADPSGAGLQADRLELMDSLYGTRKHDWNKGPDWAGWEQSIVKWSKTANGQAVQRVIYYHGSNESPRINVIRAAYKSESKGGKLLEVQMDPAKLRDNTVNPKVPDASGRDQIRNGHVVRRFELDTHYQTTGQFLGVEPPPVKREEPKADGAKKK